DTRQLLLDREMTLVAAAYQGGLLLSQGDQRKLHFEHSPRQLYLCQQFEIPTLLIVADFANAMDGTSLSRSIVSLKQAAQWASGFDVRLALEFHSKASFCTNLNTALGLITECRETNIGVNLDV